MLPSVMSAMHLPIAPPTPTMAPTTLSTVPSHPSPSLMLTPSPIHDALSTRFASAFSRLVQLRQQSYGTAYDHCLYERHVTEICTSLNILRGGADGSVMVNNIRISRDDVADWLGIPHNTFSGMVTEFKNARVAH